MSAIPITPNPNEQELTLPSRGRVGMVSLIVAESAIFTIFVVAYVYCIGNNSSGPTPQQVLEVPIVNTICLLSSSLTIWLAERQIERNRIRAFGAWWAVTVMLGLVFLVGTALEWKKMIYRDGLTIHSNLFGTGFYSLVGLHATHVIVGLLGLTTVLFFTLTGRVKEHHSERIQVLALYWHFVDGIWVVVFTLVYIIGR